MASPRQDSDFNKDFHELQQAISVYENYLKRENKSEAKAAKMKETAYRRLANIKEKANSKGYAAWLQQNAEQLAKWDAMVKSDESVSSHNVVFNDIDEDEKEIDAFIQEIVTKPTTDDLISRLADMIHKHQEDFAVRLYYYLLKQKPGDANLTRKMQCDDLDAVLNKKNQKTKLNESISKILKKLSYKKSLEKLADLIVAQGSDVAIGIYSQLLKKHEKPEWMVKLGSIIFDEQKYDRYKEALNLFLRANKQQPCDEFQKKVQMGRDKCGVLQCDACCEAKLDEVEEWIALGVRSPQLIIAAVRSGKIAVVKFVLEKKFPVGSSDGDGWNAVHWAAYLDNLPIIKLFQLSYQVLFDAKTGAGIINGGESVLSVAVRYKAENVTPYLIEKKYHINTTDQNKWTPLCWAYYNRNISVFKSLLRQGANPDVLYRKGKYYLLHQVCYDNNVEYARELLEAGADKSLRNGKQESPLDIASYNASDGFFMKGSPLAKEIVSLLKANQATKYNYKPSTSQ